MVGSLRMQQAAKVFEVLYSSTHISMSKSNSAVMNFSR